ncbi:L10-interacting MYB domain-containing protein-like [Abeliophyllum distichum]|uniref:L10-interacting MYB domain-containing protein-like n=1 Tax=Abeliophyllum distichum TaxID=126358 RepID=A0ABD1V6L4_9LAMI
MFNTEAGKDWNHCQLKNHWFHMCKEYQQLHEILRCTGIEFRGRDCRDIFHKYCHLFGDAYDFEKYAVIPSKLSKKGFNDDELIERYGNSDQLPINAEIRDEHAPLDAQGNGSVMDLSGLRIRDKRKSSSSIGKGKKKLDSRAALSESIEKLKYVGSELIAEHLNAKSGPPSFDECMEELDSFGVLEGDEKFHLFALLFFEQKRHKTSYACARTPQMKLKFLKFNYKSWCLKHAAAFD